MHVCVDLKSVLQEESYKRWMFKIPLNTAKTSGINASLSYRQRVSRKLTSVFRKQAVDTYHNLFNFIRQYLVHPKDLPPREKKFRLIYKIQFELCDDFCIKKTARPFGVRFVEHVAVTRASTTTVGDDLECSGHTLDITSSLIFVREDEVFKRRVRRPSTRFVGLRHWTEIPCYELPVIDRDVLLRYSQYKSREKPSTSIT